MLKNNVIEKLTLFASLIKTNFIDIFEALCENQSLTSLEISCLISILNFNKFKKIVEYQEEDSEKYVKKNLKIRISKKSNLKILLEICQKILH